MIEQLLTIHLTRALNYLKGEIQAELEAQGHRASGKLIDDIDVVVTKKTADIIKGGIEMEDYGHFVDTGTRPHWPPFKAIYDWAGLVKPQLNAKERKSFTFAVMTKISREGTPTRASYAFSRNGRRTAFTQFAIDNKMSQFDEVLDLFTVFRHLIDESVQEIKTRIAA